MLINPNGEIEVLLNDKEELLISRVEKSVVKQAQKEWGFKKQLKKRGLK
jgi:predicted amidohydrolase